MRVVLSVLSLSFVTIKCMPSDLKVGQDLDALPTGINGKDNAQSDITLNRDGVQLTETKTTHNEEEKEENENKENTENASEHNGKDGNSTHRVKDTSKTHKKYADETSQDKKQSETVTVSFDGVIPSEDETTVVEENQANQESRQNTHQESGRKLNFQNGVSRYLDHDEKKLGLNTGSVSESGQILENPGKLPGLRQDYLMAVARKIHNAKIVGTANGNAKIVSTRHSAQPIIYDAISNYRTLAQKFGSSPVSSHYANAHFVQSRYSNLPSFFAPIYGKVQYGADNTQFGGRKLRHGTGNTQFSGQNIQGANTPQYNAHRVASLQLSPAGWEELARKNAEIRNAKYNIERGIGLNDHFGIYRRKSHKIDPIVRDVIFSQNLKDLMRTQDPSSSLMSTLKIFGHNGRNKKIVTAPKHNANKIKNNSNTEAFASPNSDVEGHKAINTESNKFWLRHLGDSIDSINNRREKVKLDNKDFVDSNAASETRIKFGLSADNKTDDNSTYENTENSFGPNKIRSDNVGSVDDYDIKINSTRTDQLNVEDSYDSDSGEKSENRQDTAVDSNTGFLNTEIDAAKSPSDKMNSTDSNFNANTETNIEQLEENTVDVHDTEYTNFSNSNDASKDKNNELESVSLNNATEVKYSKNSNSDLDNFDKSENRDTDSINGNFNMTQANADETRKIAQSIDDDSNIDKSNVEETADASNFNSHTSETEASTIHNSTQIQNTAEFDYYGAFTSETPLNVQHSTKNSSNETSQAKDENREAESREISITGENNDNTTTEYSGSLDSSDNKTILEVNEPAVTIKDSHDSYNESKLDDNKTVNEYSIKNDNIDYSLNKENDEVTETTQASSVNSTFSSIDESDENSNPVASMSAINISEVKTTNEKQNNNDASKLDDKKKNSTNFNNITNSHDSVSETITEFGELSDSFIKINDSTPTPDTVKTTLIDNSDNSDVSSTLDVKSVSDSPIDEIDNSTVNTSVIGITKASDISTDFMTTDSLDSDASTIRVVTDAKSDVASDSTSESIVVVTTKASNDSVYDANADGSNADSVSDISEATKSFKSNTNNAENSTVDNLMDTANGSSLSTDIPAKTDDNVTDSTNIDLTTVSPSSSIDNETNFISATEIVTTSDSLTNSTLSDSNADTPVTSAIAKDSTEDSAVAVTSENITDASDVTVDTKTESDNSKLVTPVSNPDRPTDAVTELTNSSGSSDRTYLAAADSTTDGVKDSGVDSSAGPNGTVGYIDKNKPLTVVENKAAGVTEK